ncbi:MAG: hypothetical protein M3509_10040, partial [Chloroflexota bacterium]|nr:hypothetical protein [Chloroflexota bacterium]
MPRRLDPHRHWHWNDAREELLASAPATGLAVAGTTVRATAVPLFRRSEAGGLDQSIRLLASAEPAAQPLVVAVWAGNVVVDQVTLDPAAASIAHLFVPEVEDATT